MMMTSRFTPTKKKKGEIKDKSGKDWCSSDDDGGAMLDCLKFVDLETSENFKCDDKKSGNFEVTCKVDSNAD